MTKAMTAQQIGDALQKKPSSIEAYKLYSACDHRRAEIQARLTAISPSRIPTQIPETPEVAAAILKGPASMAALEQESAQLNTELDVLNRLQIACGRRQEEARRAELRAEIPAAVKRLPAQLEHLRETLSNFDAALAATQAALNTIAEFDNVGIEYPFSDDELAEMIELRNEIWRVRSLNAPHQIPPVLANEPGIYGERVKKFAKSWALLYVMPRPGVLTTRRGPTQNVQYDYAGSDGVQRSQRRGDEWPSLT